jgi:DNA primase
MGTALTEEQLKLLKRLTQRFVLALDSDVAGDQATLRGLDVARQVMDREVVPVPTPRGLIRFEERLAADIRIVSLPPGRDPDEVIRESTSHWAELIASAKPIMDYYFDALTADLELSAAKGKTEAVRRLGPLLAEMSDRVQRTHYLQLLARMVQVDERSLWQQIKQGSGGRRPGRPERPSQPIESQEKVVLDLEAHCLSFALNHPQLMDHVDAALHANEEAPLTGEDMSRPEDRVILNTWRQWLAEGGSLDPRAEFYDHLDSSLQQRVMALVEAQEKRPKVADELLRNDLLDVVTRLRLRNLRRQIYEMRFLLDDPEDDGAVATYGLLITKTVGRIGRLQRALNERSISGRRQHKDATVRVPLGEE